MAYITRELERKFLKLNDFFKVILVTGARQVGKTTMLKHLAGSDRTYVTMDNTMARSHTSDPVLFFQTYKPPILIDEVESAGAVRANQNHFAMRATKKVSFG